MDDTRTNVYAFNAPLLDGTPVRLETFRGRVLLIVNTASQCGFTPQYAGLEALYRELKDSGLTVLGFPCNQFGGQEPGTAGEIESFCQKNYEITFPVFAKIAVNGPDAHPLYQYLKKTRPGILGSQRIKWNFTKFLVDRNGAAVARFAPKTMPESMKPEIERLLQVS